MLTRFHSRVLSAIGALCVLSVIANIVLSTANQGLQGQVNERTQYIQQSAQLQRLYAQMARALADLSVRNKDEQLTAVLTRQGIKVTANAVPTAGNGGESGDATVSSNLGQQKSGIHERRREH
ncbi:MAG: hypothetical protein ACREUL_07440 [Steroidobacteraceae bacterium]